MLSAKASFSCTAEHSGISEHTARDIYSTLADKMHDYNEAEPPIFVNGDVVEIDETKIHWKDGNIEGDWVLGTTSREDLRCVLTVIEERTTSAMEGVIRRVVKEGTIVMTDALATYPGIMDRLDTTHKVINKQRDGFSRTDRASGIDVNVNKCEEMWKDFRHLMEQRNLFDATTRHRFMAEFMYNRNKKSWVDLLKF